MDYIDKIDKENNLIRLTIDQICSAGIGHNIYTGEHKYYATPFLHKVWISDITGNRTSVMKTVGLALRIANDGTIICNPSYTGNAIISFLDSKFESCKIHTAKVTKINRRSVNIEPIEYEQVS